VILLVLSTYHQPFPRAIRFGAALAQVADMPLHVQHGHTAPPTGLQNTTFQQWYTRADLGSAMREAALVVAHGGSGCIFDAVRCDKRPIAVPRLARYGEHVDDHQLRFSRFLEKQDVVICWGPDDSADSIYQRTRASVPLANGTRFAERPDIRPAVWKAARELLAEDDALLT
jgi:UDP-N-acetylglucosamine transferase subunit ALG13